MMMKIKHALPTILKNVTNEIENEIENEIKNGSLTHDLTMKVEVKTFCKTKRLQTELPIPKGFPDRQLAFGPMFAKVRICTGMIQESLIFITMKKYIL